MQIRTNQAEFLEKQAVNKLTESLIPQNQTCFEDMAAREGFESLPH